MPLDTPAAFKQLTAAGFTEGQAEVVASLMRGAGEVDLSALATKEEMRAGFAELRASIQTMKDDLARCASAEEMRVGFAELRASVAESSGLMRADILKWTMGALGLQVVAVIAAMLGIVRMMR